MKLTKKELESMKRELEGIVGCIGCNPSKAITDYYTGQYYAIVDMLLSYGGYRVIVQDVPNRYCYDFTLMIMDEITYREQRCAQYE
jgi:hypothetical protein